MADADDVRRLALALPHVVEIDSDGFDPPAHGLRRSDLATIDGSRTDADPGRAGGRRRPFIFCVQLWSRDLRNLSRDGVDLFQPPLTSAERNEI